VRVFVDFNITDGHWMYYSYDSENYKRTTEGFKNHILATEHAKNDLGLDIKIIYK